jgi:hypothetical protein
VVDDAIKLFVNIETFGRLETRKRTDKKTNENKEHGLNGKRNKIHFLSL